ncbi:MAG: S8 family serine peptidase [Candidatus Krumholzibacteriia bacterium]
MNHRHRRFFGATTLATLIAVALLVPSVSAQDSRQLPVRAPRPAGPELQELSQQFEARLEAQRTPLYFELLASDDPAAVALRENPSIELMYIDERGQPVYYKTMNLDAAVSIGTDLVWPGGAAGYALSGSGTAAGELGVWDAGGVRDTHQELTGRVNQVDSPGSLHFHATHVAGTMVAGGVDPAAQGMSFQANLDAYDWDSDNAEMAAAAAGGLQVSNHSYGQITGWNFNTNDNNWYWYGDLGISTTEDHAFGWYNDQAAAWDQIAVDAPFYLIVKSAGNDRNDNGPGAGGGHFHWDGGAWVWDTDTHQVDAPTGYECLPPKSTAKNILTIGAVNDIAGGYTQPADVVQSAFSSWGPTDDGRIKPDVVGNGVSLYSTWHTDDDDYNSISGTSMSAPSVAGSANLIVEQYEAENGASPRAATVKALILHSADEAGPADGPDYMNGWGLMNTAHAVDLVAGEPTVSGIHEAVLADGGSDTYEFDLETMAEFVRATIVWTDPAGTPPAAAVDPTDLMLVNDLDIRLEHVGNATVTMPWVLDPANPANAAGRGDNTRDNVEQTHLDAAAPGTYRVTVNHKGALDGGQQAYSLVFEVGNQAPVAVCAPDSAYADSLCCARIAAVDLDGGSTDPDGIDDIASFCITSIDGVAQACADTVTICGVGVHTVGLTVIDQGGLADTCMTTVEIIDITPPELEVVLTPDMLWPPNHKLVPISATITVTDNCDTDPTVVLTSYSSNEPDNGTGIGDGNTEDDIQDATIGTLDTEFSVRAERAGRLTGRTYTFVYTATDDSGNSTEVAAVVSVPHDMGGMAFASSGFTADGLLAHGEPLYTLVVPAPAVPLEDGRLRRDASGLNVADVDAQLAYVGNTAGVVQPVEYRLADVTGDGHEDLVLVYETAPTLEILARSDGQDGPLGLHYRTDRRTTYLVPDIQALGEPIASGSGEFTMLDKSVPQATTALSLHPNPFNPSTVVAFSLAKQGVVRVAVYDVAGRLVRELAAGLHAAGTHELQWDGTDDAGRSVRSGVYLVSMRTDAERLTQKALLLK